MTTTQQVKNELRMSVSLYDTGAIICKVTIHSAFMQLRSHVGSETIKQPHSAALTVYLSLRTTMAPSLLLVNENLLFYKALCKSSVASIAYAMFNQR